MTAMESGPIILAEQRVPIGAAQIIEWRWPSPLDITACEQRHMIEASLPPLAAEAIAFLPDVAPGRRTRVGRLFVRPAGVTIRSRSSGGRIRIVRLAVEPQAFEALTGDTLPTGEGVLRAGLDLRDGRVHWLMARLRAELEAPGFAHEALVESYALSLAIETARTLGGIAEAQHEAGRLAPWQERRVAERLAEPGPPPTVTELAALCGVSVRHFARLQGGQAAARIGAARIAQACDLLLDTALPMKVIGAQLGFAGAGSFSAAFRRATGLTPSQFRQTGGRRH
ncbi:helix-turn-helix domain-containing protein [Sphingomonas jatrophae]|uniref:AraC family transcriptional regulator n=1 Tax=Sphingomonas jatrophae TaxID=1166337 RepID=A0A1I6KHD4_9SPHN|nr:AraC family transcriptional regulator [Sphingomonas jatrophae]SFR90631.1 AraC family transcriptional regulator [Sphingomonas jatrophae]